MRFILLSILTVLLLHPDSLRGEPKVSEQTPLASGTQLVDRFTLKADRSFLDGYASRDDRGQVHAVIEIPSGTRAKWEVDHQSGLMVWEKKNRQPRVIHYLGYPVNYGMVPRTLLALEEGGDGDPLDILVLGPQLPRGALVATRLLGVLHLMDDGEIDDKLIAVVPDDIYSGVRNLPDLKKNFPGILKIIETWFENYKERIQSRGFSNREVALSLLLQAEETYKKHQH